MPSTSTNYGLNLYNRTTDEAANFIDFRDDIAGPDANSNMIKLDTALGNVSKGACYYLPITFASGNNFTATSTEISVLYTGLRVIINSNTDSTAVMTITINALSAVTVKKITGLSTPTTSDIGASSLLKNTFYELIYDGTYFILVTPKIGSQILIPAGGNTDVVILDANKALVSTTQAALVSGAIHAAASKTTPVDADEIDLIDSAASFVLKKVTWANIKATLKTYFDTLYAKIPTVGLPLTSATINTGVISYTSSFMMIDVQSGSIDDLDTVSGGANGDILVLSSTDIGRDIVVKDTTGNLRLAGDCTLGTPRDTITLIKLSTTWLEISRSING